MATRLQYVLTERAASLGWAPSRSVSPIVTLAGRDAAWTGGKASCNWSA